jgi:hypothetical protein
MFGNPVNITKEDGDRVIVMKEIFLQLSGVNYLADLSIM